MIDETFIKYVYGKEKYISGNNLYIQHNAIDKGTTDRDKSSDGASSFPYFYWLDSLKGFGILLVVMGHTCTYDSILHWIYSFHMALFFIISGLLFRPRPLIEAIKHKAKHLLVPYVFFATLTFVYWALIERHLRPDNIPVSSAFMNLFLARAGSDYPQNAVMWFLPCLFVTEIAFLILLRTLQIVTSASSNRVILRHALFIGLIVVCLAIGYCSEHWLIPMLKTRMPWALDIVPFSLSFIIIGYLLQPLLSPVDNIIRHFSSIRLGVAVLGIIGSALLWAFVQITNLNVNLNLAVVSNIAWMLIASLLGFVSSVCLCSAADNSALRYIGAASLTIMCAHEPVKRVVIQCCTMIVRTNSSTLRSSLLISCAIVAIAVCICLVAHVMIKRFAPILIGISNPPQKHTKCTY
ncbi:acyltransferase 3 [Bifidobacterium sp. DSM 109957]|uniref:Acyltransferase 3 n=2 Tax=Bifidobacterium oedipodis TaxID=2675322 RepID=A0A7Y0ERU4_9BIFI|nr:acyltransferase 3 [Bifidobacterium sp. DSM 109957]